MDIGSYIKHGKALGYAGEELSKYVEKEKNDYYAREERQKQMDHAREIELIKLRASTSNNASNVAIAHMAEAASRPKLQKFEEGTDIDAFLERFERYAVIQQWPKESWAASLSPLLAGKALDVYVSMSLDTANDYTALKLAILRRYQLTEEGFRVKFRNTPPGKSESVVQYVAKLRRYLGRWLEL